MANPPTRGQQQPAAGGGKNKLLAMLNSSSSSSSTPTGTSAPSTSGSHPPASAPSHLQPQPRSTSPREPSSLPPPPSLQAVSLSDLFKNISTTTSSPTAPPPQPQPQSQSQGGPPKSPFELSNMFPGMTAPLPPGSASTDPSTSRSSVNSPTPPMPPHHQQHLMSMLAAATVPGPPVINHASIPQHDPSPPTASILPSAAPSVNAHSSTMTSRPSVRDVAQAPAAGPNSTQPSKKSPFEFVSPFEVFQPIPQQPPSQAPPALRSPNGSPLPEQSDRRQQPTARERQSSALPAGSPHHRGMKTESSPAPDIDVAVPLAQTRPTPRPEYDVAKLTFGLAGRGPSPLSPKIEIDISKPNLESLINKTGAVFINPVANMKARTNIFTIGRTVGITSNWIAYATTKGRIRLADKVTAHSATLDIPDLRDGHILDISVADTTVAVLGSSGFVSAYNVPRQWSKESPTCSRFLHVDVTEGQNIGKPAQVEWLKDGRLAIGGNEGVIIVDPENQPIVRRAADLRSTLLQTEGTVACFALNQTHQAIGLLSETGFFSLFSIANLTRVWHRQLPTTFEKSRPCSATFIESNVIIGRNDNTIFELVQLSTELTILTSIHFRAPHAVEDDSCRVIYDPSKCVLWIASYARSSLYGFKYALKSLPPAKNVSQNAPAVIGFDRVVELALSPVLSMALSPKMTDDVELFIAHTAGLSTVIINQVVVDALNTTIPPGLPVQEDVKPVLPQSSTPPFSIAARAPVADEARKPSLVDDEGEATTDLTDDEAENLTLNAKPRNLGGEARLAKMQLKAFEDRLTKQLKDQNIASNKDLKAKIDKLSHDLSSEIAAKVDRSIKTQLQTLIQDEIRKAVLPAVNLAIQSEIRSVTSSQIPGAIHDALSSVPRELEKTLAPTIQRNVATTVQSSLDRVVGDALHNSLIPAMSTSGSNMADQVSRDLKTEMLQLRKDFEFPIREATTANDATLRQISATIADLQRQLSTLSDQVRRQAPAPAPIAAFSPSAPAVPSGQPSMPPALPPAMPPTMAPSMAPTMPPTMASNMAPTMAPSMTSNMAPAMGSTMPSSTRRESTTQPTTQQMEDMFSVALASQSTQAILQLINDHAGIMDRCFPTVPGAPPLVSQAVVFTMMHQLASTLNELDVNHPMYPRVLMLEKRVVTLVEPRDSMISTYFSRIAPGVLQTLNTLIQTLSRSYEMAAMQHIPYLKQIVDTLHAKLQSVQPV